MKWPRAGGILLHPTSLPGPYGVGDLGPAALAWLDFLAASRQKLWQVLPLHPTGFGNSPYAALSAFAGNPLLVSPERLIEDGLLTRADLDWTPAEDEQRASAGDEQRASAGDEQRASAGDEQRASAGDEQRASTGRPHATDFPRGRVDYGRVIPWKTALLHTVYARFRRGAAPKLADELASFRERHAHWLPDYALFAALKDAHDGAAWTHWPQPLRERDESALADARERLAEDIAFHEFAQLLFFRQWAAVREAAHVRGIRIIGDVPIFVAHDSADAWAHRELFQLDARGEPVVVAGVPPDYFSPTGQRWGNPLYRWDALKQSGYAWWIDRVRAALELVDIIRLDHFRGFHAYWEIPGEDETAERGRWVPGPGAALFEAIRAGGFGDVPLIAEDLGQLTLGVHRLRQRLGLPGMRVLQFGFGGNAKSAHLPHNFTRDTVVYTGTHDNDTTRGWFAAAGEHERAYALRYLDTDAEHIVRTMVRAAYASVAALAIVPLQDVLDLGSAARMNFPSRPSGNWEWRAEEGQLTPAVAKWLVQLATTYGR